MTGFFARVLRLLLSTALVAGLLATGPNADASPLRPSPSPKPRPGETAALTCPNATDRDQDYLCPIGPTYTLPGLTDLNGWTDPGRTIAYGDLDGDGIDEMVARSGFGVVVYRFDPALGQWSQISTNQVIMSDAQGADDPKYGSTLQLGDVDGLQGAELVARAPAGMIVAKFTFDKAKNLGTWTVTQTAQLGDGQGFDKPEYYRTIRLVPLGTTSTSPGLKLMARGPDGLRLYQYAQGAWVASAVETGFSDANGWNQPQHYSTIIAWDATTLIARASDGLFTATFSPGTGTGAGWGSWTMGKQPNGVWTDAQGWTAPEYYSTITPLRGHDSQVVLAARVPGGIGSAALQAGGDWVANPTATGDDSMWSQPSHYATVQAGDVNGDQADELLARGPGGMLTYTFDGSTGRFAGPISPNIPALSDAAWSDASRYQTIATAQLEPGKGRALLARGGHGVRTWRFDTTSNTFTRYRPYGSFPALDETALDQMQRKLQLSIPVRQTFNDPTIDTPADALRGYMQAISGLCPDDNRTGVNPDHYSACPAPADVDVSTEIWTTVSNQLIFELYSAANVVDHFDELNAIQIGLFLNETNELPTIKDDLSLQQAASVVAPPPPTPRPDLLGLFEGITELLSIGVGLLPEMEPVALALEVTSASLSIAAAATPESDPDRPSSSDEFAATYEAVATKLTTHQQQMQDQIGNHRHYVLADYGLLVTVGHLVGSLTWTLDEVAGASAGRQSFTRWVYQRFLPALWDRWEVQNCWSWAAWDATVEVTYYCNLPAQKRADGTNGTNVEWTAPQCDSVTNSCTGGTFTSYLPRQTPCTAEHGGFANRVYFWDCTFVGPDQDGYADTVGVLFDPVSTACTYNSRTGSTWVYGKCNLGVDIAELASWAFTLRKCTYDVGSFNWGGQCNGQEPPSLVTGSATLRGQRAGQVTMTLRESVPKGFDLRGARVQLERVLHEGAVGAELVKHPNGAAMLPATTTVARGSTSKRAEFTITVKPPKSTTSKPAKARGPGSKAAHIHGDLRINRGKLVLRLDTDRTALNLPQACGADGLVRLGTHIVVTDRKGRSVQYLDASSWRCVDPPGPRPLSKLTYPAGP